MISDDLVSLQWLWAFELLSMDTVAGFYEPMGLHIKQGREFRSILRSALKGEYNTGVGAFSNKSKKDVVVFYKTHILPAVGEIGATISPATASYLQFWIEDTYMESGNPWVTYNNVLDRCWSQYRNHGTDPLQLGSNADEIYGMLRETVELDDIESQMKVAERAELSEWDRKMYEYKGVDEQINWYPHYDTIMICVSRNRFQLLWERLLLKLSEPQLEILTNLAADSGVRAQSLRRRLPPLL